jgi:ribulose 1,5-bisphosphate synthetase/thiazole synthase
MMTGVNTHGLWSASAPPAPVTGPLTEDRTADVVVGGAGFTGLSAALHLAERQASVVLEAHQVGMGGSGRNVGLVNAGLW